MAAGGGAALPLPRGPPHPPLPRHGPLLTCRPLLTPAPCLPASLQGAELARMGIRFPPTPPEQMARMVMVGGVPAAAKSDEVRCSRGGVGAFSAAVQG